MATAWYDSLREEYRPDRVRLLLIAESPPDPHQGDGRFFYAPDLKVDNLYRSVALALYGHDPTFNERDKPAVLQRMKRDGVSSLPTRSGPPALLGAGRPALLALCRSPKTCSDWCAGTRAAPTAMAATQPPFRRSAVRASPTGSSALQGGGRTARS